MIVLGSILLSWQVQGQTNVGAAARLQVAGDGLVQDQVSGLFWTATDNGEDVSWEEAGDYCSTLPPSRAGTWRLATRDELKTLVNRRGLPLKIQPGIQLTDAWVWSEEGYEDSLAREEERPMAWFMSFLSGKSGATHGDRSEGLRALCVSGP
jgi:hypothetical protein